MKTTTTRQAKQHLKEATNRARTMHYAALEVLAPGQPGIVTWRKLAKIERIAHDAATAQCNGADYGTQPFRPGHLPDGSEGTEANPTPWDKFTDEIYAKVAKVFGGKAPAGFRFNQDPRGYALKIDPDKAEREAKGSTKAKAAARAKAIPAGMVTDWGGYGCLAATID